LDRISPLAGRNPIKGHCRYSIAQVAAHITGRLGARLVRELKGGWIKLDIACSRMRMPQGTTSQTEKDLPSEGLRWVT
jgi:hypothetical protein